MAEVVQQQFEVLLEPEPAQSLSMESNLPAAMPDWQRRAARAVSVEHKRQSMSVLAGSYIACNLTVTESLATRLA